MSNVLKISAKKLAANLAASARMKAAWAVAKAQGLSRLTKECFAKPIIIKSMEFKVVSASNGKEISVSCDLTKTNRLFLSPFFAFGVRVDFAKTPEGGNVIKMSDDGVLSAKKELESFFGVKMKSGGATIRLTQESEAAIEEAKEKRAAVQNAVKSAYDKAVAAAKITKYVVSNYVDIGDYTITTVREITSYRNAVEGEGEGEYIAESICFNNAQIGSFGPKWVEMFGKESGIETTKDVFEFWKAAQIEIAAEKEKAEAERIAKIEAERIAKAEALAAKFKEARETNKPVLISSVFLSGDAIPYEFRDEDSDMGNLNSYAMPNGSIKNIFSHAH